METIKTKNFWWFAAGLGVLGSAFLLRSPYMAFALYAFLLLLLLANATSRLWLSGLDCSRVLSASVLRQGEPLEVEVTLANRRGWPIPWLFIEDIMPPSAHITGENRRLAILMPGREINLKYTLYIPSRGYYRVGPLLMETGDLFGLQKRFRTGRRQDYVSVLPSAAFIDTFTVSARRPQGPVKVSNRIYEDPTHIAGLREYQPGDPLNRIHWKASARMGSLYVKQVEPSRVLGATLVLDLFHAWYQGDDAQRRLELAVTTTASLAYLLQMSGEQVGMMTNARDAAEVAQYEVAETESLSRHDAESSVAADPKSDRLSPLEVPTARSPLQARRIMESLARVLPTDGLDIGAALLAALPRLPRDAALLPIVPHVTEDLAMAFGAAKLAGFAMTVFLIANNANHPHAAAWLAAHEIDVIHIEDERNLYEIKPERIGR